MVSSPGTPGAQPLEVAAGSAAPGRVKGAIRYESSSGGPGRAGGVVGEVTA